MRARGHVVIGYLDGIVVACDDATETIFAYGVGYEVHCAPIAASGQMEQLWIHEHAPQDAPHELYGFRERADRDLFRRLLNCKGVGPKVAMRIITNGGLKQAIEDGTGRVLSTIVVPSTLRAIRGVGDKIIAVITADFS